jgi:hypothetical protein
MNKSRLWKIFGGKMEQIYTIPVNEAFDLVSEKPECGCPFCVLFKKLQNDEIDIILGASMMEPDIRIKTNKAGFCLDHYSIMLKRKRMLGMGLMLESHLAEVKKLIDSPGIFGDRAQRSLAGLSELEGDCYVCGRINHNLSMMVATAVYLFETDYPFRDKLKKAPYFCLPHYRMLLQQAKGKLPKRIFPEFYDTVRGIEMKYIEELSGDVSWFCKKFDYRYDEEPWYNSKDSVPRAVKFLSSDKSDSE